MTTRQNKSNTIVNTKIKTAYSLKKNSVEAIEEISTMLKQEDKGMYLIFISSQYDPAMICATMKDRFKHDVYGCTTSGEINNEGYSQNSITGFSFPYSELEAYPFLFTSINDIDTDTMFKQINRIRARVAKIKKRDSCTNLFGILLIDGLSVKEEQFVAILANALEDIPIVGGSAGDDFKLFKTHIFFNEKCYAESALFILFVTDDKFETIKTQHFKATEKRLVITKADPEKRKVYEINGRPAADEYARIIEHDTSDLSPQVFSSFPLLLRYGGEYFIRSIQQVNDDASLTFFCAIDEGLVLRIGYGENIVENLENAFNRVRETIPNIKLTIGFDCILRLVEINQKKLEGDVNRIFRENKVIGFNTYGEQFNALHINQTFTGVVLGE